MLELRNITAGYGPHTVLRGVDLVVPDHSVVALLGPNGAGKTTMLRIASGLLTPSGGTVLLDGEDVTGWPAHRLAESGVCHVPEGRGIFRSLTVGDNLRLQSRPGQDASAVEVATAAFPRLGERIQQRAGTMSGGEQQMLALAHSYVASPDIVLLDEVSMGLAPKIVDDIFDKLKELAERGAALLIVEQYVDRALALADYVYVLKKGRVALVSERGQISGDSLAESYLGAH